MIDRKAIREACRMSFKNRRQVMSSKQVGCYYCGHTCGPEDIKEWTDNGETALCPRCSVDSIVPSSEGVQLSEEMLKRMNQYWFWGKN